MDAMKIGELIRQQRKAHALTQSQLAEHLHVSEKAVSKWERGAGCPDVSLIPALSAFFNISAEGLLRGNLPASDTDGGNMKRIKVYQCPLCGNIVTATGTCELLCCGHKLAPLPIQPADEQHRVALVPVEDEWLVTFTHPMEKEHHLSFVMEVGYDRVVMVRLYAEGGCETRLPRISGGQFFAGCNRDGLFSVVDE